MLMKNITYLALEIAQTVIIMHEGTHIHCQELCQCTFLVWSNDRTTQGIIESYTQNL